MSHDNLSGGEESMDEYMDEYMDEPELVFSKIHIVRINDTEYRFYIYSDNLISLSVKYNQQIDLYLFDKVRDERWEFCYWNPDQKVYHVLARCNLNTDLPPIDGWDTLSNNFIEALILFRFDVI